MATAILRRRLALPPLGRPISRRLAPVAATVGSLPPPTPSAAAAASAPRLCGRLRAGGGPAGPWFASSSGELCTSPWAAGALARARALAAAARAPSHYEVLGVASSATQAEIKRAYLREAKKCHPDVSGTPDSTRRFQELAQAYQILGDPARRAEYDRHRLYEQQQQQHSRQQQQQQSWQGQQQSWQDQPQEPVDASKLFRAVLEELGAEQLAKYLESVQLEASEAARKAQGGDLQPALDFAQRHRALAVGVLLPVAVLLRFPGIVGFVLRLLGLLTAFLIQSPRARDALGQWAWIQWRLLLQRARARARNNR